MTDLIPYADMTPEQRAPLIMAMRMGIPLQRWNKLTKRWVPSDVKEKDMWVDAYRIKPIDG